MRYVDISWEKEVRFKRTVFHLTLLLDEISLPKIVKKAGSEIKRKEKTHTVTYRVIVHITVPVSISVPFYLNKP